MLRKIAFGIFILFFSLALSANELKPFVTDNCTMFVDGTYDQPTLWRHCCVLHDIRYWYGGSEKNQDQADLNLRFCVQKVAGEIWADLIYSGVRAGHLSPVKNKYKWSWGWTIPRQNKELTAQEKTYVIEKLHQLPYSYEMIDNYIKNNF